MVIGTILNFECTINLLFDSYSNILIGEFVVLYRKAPLNLINDLFVNDLVRLLSFT